MRLAARRLAAWAGFALLVSTGVAGQTAQTPIFSQRDRVHPVHAANGMVVSQEALATRVGVAVLEAGGNAVDAAVAVGFALAVTLPQAGNLGGGGFMLVHRAEDGGTAAIDYRETAPAAAHRDMFLDEQGDADPQKSRFSYLSAGVPGTVAGLALALERYGTLPLARVVEPAIRLAEEGIEVTPGLAEALARARERLSRSAAAMRIFYKPDGGSYAPGERLAQLDLGRSLRRIAEHGPDAFYRGPVAERIAADMARNGGLVTAEDLAAYRAVVREPVRGTYRDYEVLSMPPPSSGGVHLVQLLNVLEGYPLASLGHNGADTVHLMAEAMKLAYADRSRHLGDPDFWPVPVAWLTSKTYAAKLRARIAPERARPSTEIGPGEPPSAESPQTTHFSVVDRWGNAVSNTYTLNFSFGSGHVAAGTGILLNNELDDFSAKPGVPNAYGLVGGEANAVAPGKRPLSSMTPTIVLKDGEPFLVTGSPGGSRIITSTLQILLNVIDHGMNVAEASHAPRVHHQWLPDELRVEEGLGPDTVRLLEARGHRVVAGDVMGGTQSILRRPHGLFGASDPRRRGGLALGH